MTEWLKHFRKQAACFLSLCLCCLLSVGGWAQTQAQTAQQKQEKANPASPEGKISPQQAEDLFRSVDEVLRFDSKDTNLPIKHEVKRKLTSRDEVEAYLVKSMDEDKDTQRLRRSELVLKKFGLLPRDFDLRTYQTALLREQVAGYYDPKTQTVNLLDWLPAEQQKPVLAHELTHALQDQSFGLENWMKAGSVDLDDKKDLTPADIDQDEAAEARQAIVEGQAMVTLIDYMLAPYGKSLKDSPELLETLKQSMIAGTADSPQFQKAPVLLQEALIFPYVYGIDFVAAVARKHGADKAFAGMFVVPPHTTRQIMEPETYLADEQVAPMPLPDFKQSLKNYDRFDIGAFGEFDVSILVRQYAGKQMSREMYPSWRGGYYYAGRPKSAPSGPLSLLFVSRWSNAERASQFAAIYAKSLPSRYKQTNELLGAGGKPEINLNSVATLAGTHTWQTEEGPVTIGVVRDFVMITEGLDQSTTEHLALDLFPMPVVAGK